jgi:membrane associated rhomboid family serine protease
MANRRPIYPSGSSELIPTGVKWLLIINVAVFFLYNITGIVMGYGALWYPLGLIPGDVIQRFAVWQLVTYMFLHDPTGLLHILFNMLGLWVFGATLERTWGTREFLKYYLLCGIGAGLCVVVANLLFSANLETRTIGASGAIFGLLVAFAYLFPDQKLLVEFIVPMKAKYYAMIFGAAAFLFSLQGTGGGVSHIAHLGGMVIGFIYLRSKDRAAYPTISRRRTARPNPFDAARGWYKSWKTQRARRKFEVYMKNRDRDRDRFVH